MRLPSLAEHDLLLMWLDLLLIVGAARALGTAMRRIGQPPVVGELLAGVLLGPSVLVKLWPPAAHVLVPTNPTAAAPLNTLGWVGVGFLLVLTGFETDLRIIRRLGRPATFIAVGGLLLPFAAGLAIGAVMPHGFMGDKGTAAAFVLFIAISLSISSLPVIAKILEELGFMRRNFAQVTIAVGMVNDLVGWLALGVIAALGRSNSLSFGSVAIPVLAIAAFLVLAFTVGQRAVDWTLAHVRRREASDVDAMTVTLLVTFLFAVLTQVAKSDAVLGAYIAGIIIGRSRYFRRQVGVHLESLTMAVFAPLFFATAGLRIDLGSLANGSALMWAGIVIVVAVATKVVGAFAAARFAGLDAREGLALSVGLNCRGAVEVVIATVGLQIGVLSSTAYTAIVLMAIVTSVMAPPLLRLIVRDWRGTPEEQERLDREESMDRNLLIRRGRLLLPSRGGPSSVTAARVLNAAWPPDVPVTVMSVDDAESDPPDLSAVFEVFNGRDLEVRHVRQENPLQAVLDQTLLGYGAVGLGARDSVDAGAILTPVVDDLLGQCRLPMVIVRRGRDRCGGVSEAAASFRRALVPVAGTPASRTAQELAFGLSGAMRTEVVVTHVVDRPGAHEAPDPYPPGRPPREPATAAAGGTTTAAAGVIEQAVALASEHDVAARPSVRAGTSTADVILEEATLHDADLIVLGTTVRRLQGRPFLGHTVEHLLEHADATVVVVATPDTLLSGGLSERHP